MKGENPTRGLSEAVRSKALFKWSENPEVEGDLIGVSTLQVKSFNSMRE